MKKNSLLTIMLFTGVSCWAQKNSLYVKKLTNINPVSYTDVIYTGVKDTVLVSTYSGRISKVINGNNKETVLAAIEDEIYALAYYKRKREIIASTLTSGIVIINERNGNVVKKLPLGSSWSNSLVMSDNQNYLVAYNQKGERYIYDLTANYQRVDFDTTMPAGRIIKIDTKNVATLVTSKKVILWGLTEKRVVKEWDIELTKFGDIDHSGEILSIDFNTCSKLEANSKTVAFKITHPDWPLPNPTNKSEVFEIPLQLQINAAKFARNYIYTGGIDRTVRVWDKRSGKLLTTLTGHKGSISKIKVASDESQVVSVDLKGILQFWNVE